LNLNKDDRRMPLLQHTPLADRMARLLAAPAAPQANFILGRLTYQALFDLAYGLKGALETGENPGQPVCLYTEEKALTAAAMLVAAAAGTPPMLLPYALTPDALQDIHTATGACRVITDRPDDLPAPMAPVTFAPAGFPDAGLPAAPVDKVMVQLFTGGSTGSPQIWPKTVGNLFGEAFFMAQQFAVDRRDCFLAATVPYHIYGLLFAVLVPLVASAGVAPDLSPYPHDIRDALDLHRATVFAGVPMHYRVLRSVPMEAGNLRLALSSAGRLDPEDGADFFRRTGIGVTEIYGSTETGGVALRNRALGESALAPLASVATRISGERLYVRSPYLAPTLETDANGFFLTGDRVREESGGGFVLLGRADGIVKVGGKRVDLEGVQACLQSLPGIRDALVLALPAGGGRENEIVAVVEGAVDIAVVRRFLAGKVEPYALPRRLVTVDKIRMSAAGKYDHQAAVALFANHKRP
jgi:acyl-coenzyme A synthetase/AMP-(fatty) acid ligase